MTTAGRRDGDVTVVRSMVLSDADEGGAANGLGLALGFARYGVKLGREARV